MDEPISQLQEETRAIDLIARSPEGRLLHRYLRRVLEGCFDFPDTSALQSHHGRRSLARDLMLLMAQGLADTARTDAGRTTTDNDAILSPGARGGNVARFARGRRVSREPDDGWGSFDDGAGSTSSTGNPSGSGRGSGST